MDLGRPWVMRGLVIALAVSVGFIAWLATRGSDDEPAPAPEQVEARLVSPDQLADLAGLSGHPVYWAGSIPGTELEATESADGGVQVRYLEAGTEAGEESAAALTIGSYPLSDPAGALDEFAARPGSVSHRARDGREVVVNRESPTSAYFVDPANTVQVEVYDPSPKRALGLALSGKVHPVR